MTAEDKGQSAGREVFVAGRPGPRREAGSRTQHMQRLALSDGYVWPAALITGGLIVLGAILGRLTLALVAVAVVLCVLAVRLWREAGAEAERDALEAFANSRGFNFKPSMMLIASTPLLAAGDSRRCEHYMHGPLRGVEGTGVGIAQFVIQTRHHKYDRRKRPIAIDTPHSFTLAIVDLVRPAGAFAGVYLVRRPDARDRFDWLSKIELVPATLDHPPLAANCDLMLRPGQDREALRELMRVGLQRAVVESDLTAGFEYENGTLVVYSARRLRTSAELDALVALTGHVARSLIAAGEPLSVPENLTSMAPPTGVAAFPPPPPATHPVLRVAPASGGESVPPPLG